ncbi:hypothetical protein GUJ93_ZPchr0005g15378 [Zizania palustris]|uniref:Uncharacterized protein n=1 Tax=Zizania palustris TaxID=103762 RepID=A0A8J5VE35_ZIZPA|nr:hypothetical protein GUJ93_ZPchr0005g15378 [Zizania palustris]
MALALNCFGCSTISDTKESDDIVESSGSTISSVVGGIIVDSDDKRATSRSSSWMTPALSAAHSDAVAHLCRWSSFYGVGNGYLWLWLDGRQAISKLQQRQPLALARRRQAISKGQQRR